MVFWGGVRKPRPLCDTESGLQKVLRARGASPNRRLHFGRMCVISRRIGG